MDGLTVITSRVDGFEGFRDAVHGSHVDVMQLQRGRFRGLLTHIGVGDFSLSVGSFCVGLRTQRTSSDPKLIVGMLLGAESRVTHWSYDMDPGDVLVIPPGVDHDGRFHGASSYAALRLDLADVASAFGGESWMSDPANWRRKHRYRADPRIGAEAVAKLREIVSRLSDPDARVSPEAADFWRRAIIDVVTATVMHSQPPGTTETIASAT
jgi:AraC family ethanolamine operon transcriptional activator